jgi:hypothetical protein
MQGVPKRFTPPFPAEIPVGRPECVNIVTVNFVQVIIKFRGLISAHAEKPMSDFSRHGIQP